MDDKNSLTSRWECSAKTNFYRIITVMLLYGLSGRLGQFFAINPGNVTAVWPPSGIALGAMILYGYKIWPGILLGCLGTTTWAFISSTTPEEIIKAFSVGMGASVGAVLQAMVGTYLTLKYCQFKYPFDNAKGTGIFIIIGIVSCLVNATIGSLSLFIGGFTQLNNVGITWLTWWLGDVAGVLIFAPTVLCWVTNSLTKFEWTAEKTSEAFILFLLATMTSYLIFNTPYPLVYFLILIPIWAVFRFSLTGATTLVLYIIVMAISYTVNNQGPFVSKNINESLIMLQTFIGVAFSLTLLLGAVLEERNQKKNEILALNLGLEQKVEARTLELNQKNIELEKTLEKVKNSQKQLIVREKLASLGFLTKGIAHEIRNPLHFISNFSMLIHKYIQKAKTVIDKFSGQLDEQDEDLLNKVYEHIENNTNKIKSHIGYANGIVTNMLKHASSQTSELELTDLNKLVDEYYLLAYHAFRSENFDLNVKLEASYDHGIKEIYVHPQELGRAISNILNNSFYSTIQKLKTKGKEFLPIISVRTFQDHNNVYIIIRDNGEGIDEENLEHLFEPFFTTKPPGEGAGLGLSICYDIIVNEHNGDLTAHTKKGLYTELEMRIPKHLEHPEKK